MARPFQPVVVCCTTFFAVISTIVADSAHAETLRLPVVKDNSIVMVDGEWSQNAGHQGRIRIKGNQHIVAMDFDVSAIAGKIVRKATLVCEQGDQTISAVSISTIATPWDEEKSNGLRCGIDSIPDWGYPGARFPAVCGGNGNTLVHQCRSELKDGKYYWDVPPDMVHAIATGAAFGLAIHEHDADYGGNPTIYSRDQSGKKPWLEVDVEPASEPRPAAPTAMKVQPLDQSSASLTFVPAKGALTYRVTVDGHPLARHLIPFASNTGPKEDRVQIALRDLPASLSSESPHEISVVAVSRTGKDSEPASHRAVLFRKSAALKLPPVNTTSTTASSGASDISVIPVLDKYDATGNPVGNLPADYRTHNAVFDGKTITLRAAAGEVTGFQMLVRGNSSESLSVVFDPAFKTELWQAVYVPAGDRSIPDPLLPLPEKLALQKNQDVCVIADVYVPFDATPGVRKGQVRISDGRTLPIELEVLPFALPKEATFFCEMNGYGLPDHVDEYYKLQKVAYDHRVHSNILHYSHNTAAPGSRKSNLDMRLRSGRRMDNKRYDNVTPGAASGYWDDFADAFGPCLDGSLFADGHRGPVAVSGFYLTFHESWPLNCREYFDGNPDAYEAFSKHPEYSQTFVNLLQDFAQLAQKNNWNRTRFQVYLNNKGSLNDPAKAPWILDEPSGFWDYRALQYYGELTDRGRSGSSDVRIDYRIDISRPEYCRGQLDGRNDLWVVASSAFQNYKRLVTDRIARDGLTVWVYGTSNHVHESNRNLQAWALDARRFGASGLVPWQTVNKDGSALKKADQLGLFIFDQDKDGQTVVRHSLRLKAWRDAQQLIEYLNLLQKKMSWTDEDLRHFVSQYVQLDAEVQKTNEDDAGTINYGRISPAEIDSLRSAAASMLSTR